MRGLTFSLALQLTACSFVDDFGEFRIVEVARDAAAPGDAGTDGGAGFVDCRNQPDGTACGSGRGLLCISGVCRVSSCGDGYVDEARDEQCDDENTVPGDGCEPAACTYSCEENADCDNEFVCDGVETCEDHRCIEGTQASGDDCTRVDGQEGACMAGYCVPPGCGDGNADPNEECDGQAGCRPDCLMGCTSDAACPDDNLCDDVPRCDLLSGECKREPAPSCDDGDACTADTCLPASGCRNVLVDQDQDGFAPGTCKPGSALEGGDCDDRKPTVYPGATEYCDQLDNDCDGTRDDSAVKATCYPDADGDGFPLREGPVEACVCPDGTLPERADGAWDCWDELDDVGRDVFPGQTDYFASGYNARCREGASPCEVIHSFDFDCDGQETQLLNTGNVNSCGALGGALSCSPSGYTSTPPACGESGAFLTCMPNGGLLGGCSSNTMARAQLCH